MRDDWAGLRKPLIATPTPHNGAHHHSLDKQAQLTALNEAAIEEQLASRSHQPHLIEGECHELH